MEIYTFTILVEMSIHFSTRASTSDHRFHFYTSYFRTISRDSIRLTGMIRGSIDQHGESIFSLEQGMCEADTSVVLFQLHSEAFLDDEPATLSV